jgi:hypothetical protein
MPYAHRNETLAPDPRVRNSPTPEVDTMPDSAPRRHRSPVILTVLLLVLSLAAGALAAPRVLELSGPDAAALARQDAAREDAGGPERFALPADLQLDTADPAGWDRLPDGSHRWRLTVRAPGSRSLNFGFERFRLPWRGRLTISGTHGPERVFTAADNADHGQLWTPVVLGDTAELTLVLPDGERRDHELVLARVGRGYRLFGEPPADKLGDCNIDVICPEGDGWREEIRSVGVYTVSGVWKCTGAMINNTAEDGTPYFLTANHCNVGAGNAASVVVYWNFESPVCGQLGGGTLDDAQSGAIWRASYIPSDMTLLELAAPPDTTWRVTYAGWDRSGTVPPSAVTIHHPDTEIKCISFEDDPLEITSYLQTAPEPDGTHWRVVDWDLGTTEPGSSGCPLFDPQRRIIGQLHGGAAACGNDESDWYGRLSMSWEGGGAPFTQLATWLDPLQTGATTLDLFDPLAGEEPEDPDLDPRRAAHLAPPVPNPSTDGPRLRVQLDRQGAVTLRVYDLRGRLVETVFQERVLPQGITVRPLTTTGLPSGVYLCRLEALGEVHTRKLTILR